MDKRSRVTPISREEGGTRGARNKSHIGKRILSKSLSGEAFPKRATSEGGSVLYRGEKAWDRRGLGGGRHFGSKWPLKGSIKQLEKRNGKEPF